MSLFVLRKGFRVVTTQEGGRVVHARTGDELSLGPEEIQLLARASAGGLDGNDPALRPLIKKLASLGILATAGVEGSSTSAAGSAPAALPEAPGSAIAPQSGSSIVPRLRSDLVLARRAGSSLVDITQPATGRTFQLYDFELSLARMLDGKRFYAEVVEAGQRLGIPVSVQSLSHFVRELERYGFLSAEELSPPAGAQSVWAPRQKWDDALRTLFQSGLRMYRQGRYEEARGYFQAVLEQDPANPEALDMLAQLEHRVASSGGTGTHEGAEAAGEGLPIDVGELFGSAAAAAAPSGEAAGPTGLLPEPSAAPDPANPFWRTEVPASAVQEPDAPGDELRVIAGPRRRRRVLAIVALGLMVVVGVGGAFWWQRPEVVGPSSVSPPSKVELPTQSLTTTAESKETPEDAGAPAPAVVDEATAQTPPATAADDPRKWISVEVVRRGRVKMAEVVAPASGTVEWTVAPRERVRRGGAVGRLHAGSKRYGLTAGKAGVLMPTSTGEPAKKGQVLAALLYHEAFVQAEVRGGRPKPRWPCQLVHPASGQHVDCKVVTSAKRGDGFLVTVTAEPLWLDEVPMPVLLRLSPTR